MDNKNMAAVLGVLALALVLLYWSVSAQVNERDAKKSETSPEKTMVSGIPVHSQKTFEKAKEAETEDPCATPEGYTDDSWRQHMGHHPDQYKECL